MCTLANISTVHEALTNDDLAEKATALDYREMVEETPLYTLRKMVLRQFLCASPSHPLSNTSLTRRAGGIAMQWPVSSWCKSHSFFVPTYLTQACSGRL